MTSSKPDRTQRGARPTLIIERTQTGVRMEKHLLKVLKALAEYHDLSLGDLLEGIVLHAFDGKPVFGPAGRERIRELKRVYGLELDASHSHRLTEAHEAHDSHEAHPPRETPATRAKRDSRAALPKRKPAGPNRGPRRPRRP